MWLNVSYFDDVRDTSSGTHCGIEGAVWLVGGAKATTTLFLSSPAGVIWLPDVDAIVRDVPLVPSFNFFACESEWLFSKICPTKLCISRVTFSVQVLQSTTYLLEACHSLALIMIARSANQLQKKI